MMRRRFFLLGALLGGIAIAGLAPPANADFEISISDGAAGDSFVVNQSGFVSSTGNGAGSISVSANLIDLTYVTVGGFTIVLSGSTDNAPGTAALAKMSLVNAFVSYSGTSAETLTITESTSNGAFTAPNVNPVNLTSALTTTSFDSGDSGAPTDLVSLTSSIVGQTSAPTVSTGPGELATAGSSVVVTDHTTPFDLQNVFTITLSNQGSIATLDGTVTVTAPEPTSMVMGLVGLGTLGVAGWCRRARRPV